ncbi:MAG: PAS domain-containing sensor histidine kinase [Thermoplasmata archaeon]|nr:PAS domain-containing sensor histidine kinase [Thermoplasmata archaeon]MBE3140276.1 PAS domain-containing sensor histidine kinase [Thermoplasmata archaeon]
MNTTERKQAVEELRESEILLNDVGEMAHVGGWKLDTKTKEVYWTKETYRIHEISIDEKFDLSKAILFYDLPDRSNLEAALQRCMETGEPFDLVLPFTSAKGRHLWTRAIGRAVKNDSGKVVRLMGTFQDITERKKAEMEVNRQREMLQKIFDHIPVMITYFDKTGEIKMINHEVVKILGWTFEEWKTENILANCYPESEAFKEALDFMVNKPIGWKDFKTTTKYGTVIDTTWTNISLPDGVLMGIGRDITERKQADEKIKKQIVQLKKLDGVKTDFLNTTSHELRTPVTSIKGYIQMLLKQTLGEITEEQKKALEVLLRNTNRLDHLIQDILDISRLESETMKFITEKIDVTKIVKEIAETMQVSADLKGIKINIDIQKEIPNLMIDQERIKQVLMNLVDNAIKFSPDGSMIHIKTRKEKEDVLFEVQDFGRGIPKNKQKKIFERFYQVDSGIDRKFGGVGLGLTISKKIIDTYGGQIWVDSTIGKGSSFKFSVPLQTVKNIEDDLQEIFIESP